MNKKQDKNEDVATVMLAKNQGQEIIVMA